MKSNLLNLISKIKYIESLFRIDYLEPYDGASIIFDHPEFIVWIHDLKQEINYALSEQQVQIYHDILNLLEKEFNGFTDVTLFRQLKGALLALQRTIAPIHYINENENTDIDPPKVFISHSSIDKPFVSALTDLLINIGLDQKYIIATSEPKTQLTYGDSLYDQLKTALSNKNVLVIFLLSENFYTSPICLNEMGAVWINNSKYYAMLLPAFKSENFKGVINNQSTVYASLSYLNNSTISHLKRMCLDIANRYNFSISDAKLELELKKFFDSIEAIEKSNTVKDFFSMEHAKGVCIGDYDNDGCIIDRRNSTNNITTATIDFKKTASSLCSVVFRTTQRNWSSLKRNGNILYFEMYTESEPFLSEIELRFHNHTQSTNIAITNDFQQYWIPLSQFNTTDDDWECVYELSFLFHKKKMQENTSVIIKNLHFK